MKINKEAVIPKMFASKSKGKAILLYASTTVVVPPAIMEHNAARLLFNLKNMPATKGTNKPDTIKP